MASKIFSNQGMRLQCQINALAVFRRSVDNRKVRFRDIVGSRLPIQHCLRQTANQKALFL
jgi:hypothetical protein